METVTTNNESTVLKIKNKYKEITIEVPYSNLSIDQVMEDLVKPALIGMGYNHLLIDEIFGENDDD
jgi:hypothetical protein